MQSAQEIGPGAESIARRMSETIFAFSALSLQVEKIAGYGDYATHKDPAWKLLDRIRYVPEPTGKRLRHF
jgi:hypothetical protein